MKEKIGYYLKTYKDQIKLSNDTVKIRIAGDGTSIARNFTVLNMTFGFLDPINKSGKNNTNPNSVLGNFALGVFSVASESYDELICLHEINEEIKHLKEIQIDGTVYKLDFYLGGDMKFVLLVYGLKAANSGNPCVYCVVHKDKFGQFYISSEEHRIIGDSSQEGQERRPIFDSIPVNKFCVDILHLNMRVTDKLESNLCLNLEEFDCAHNLADAHYQRKYAEFLESISIKKPFQINKNKYEFKKLNGQEKKKLFAKIDLEKLFPSLPNVKKISKLWKSFSELINDIKDEKNYVDDHLYIKGRTKYFGDLYLSVYGANEMTPYLHILISHIHEIIHTVQQNKIAFNDFSMEGLEQMNNAYTTYYIRSNNKKNSQEPIKQILQKRNRIEILTHSRVSVDLISELQNQNMNAEETNEETMDLD